MSAVAPKKAKREPIHVSWKEGTFQFTVDRADTAMGKRQGAHVSPYTLNKEFLRITSEI